LETLLTLLFITALPPTLAILLVILFTNPEVEFDRLLALLLTVTPLFVLLLELLLPVVDALLGRLLDVTKPELEVLAFLLCDWVTPELLLENLAVVDRGVLLELGALLDVKE